MKILISLLFSLTLVSYAGSATPLYPNPATAGPAMDRHSSGGMMSVIRSLDPRVLQSKDEAAVNRYVDELNKKITFYVSETYREDISSELAGDRYAILHAGLWIGLWEEGTGQRGSDITGRGNIGNCLPHVLGAVMGIDDIISQYNALIHSSGWNGAWRFIKGLVRRAVGWFGAVYAFYELGNCMNWW